MAACFSHLEKSCARICFSFRSIIYIFLQRAAKVSILLIEKQDIIDGYICLLHLTAGILRWATSFYIYTYLLVWELTWLLVLPYTNIPKQQGRECEALSRQVEL